MSERAIALLLIAGALCAAPVAAQDLAQLKRRQAELEAQLERLRTATADSAEQKFWGQARTVVSSGPLHLAYPEQVVAAASDTLGPFLEAQRRRYGVALDSLLTDTLYGGLAEELHPTGVGGAQWRLGALRGEQARKGDWMETTVATALQRWSQELLDPALRAWLGAIDSRSTVATLRDPLVRDLVGSRSSRARRCLNGAADECRLLLELDEGATPLLSAYDPADLPPLFRAMDLNDGISGRANCVGKRDPAACAELVRQGVIRPPHPVSARARQSLFTYALAAGGDDAWLRLSRAHGLPVAEQLGIAAGRPVDSLLVEWQHDLKDGRRTTTSSLGPSLVLALIWGVVGTLFFAWRYRWRHV
ncbi:MAG TPA: hypothetical protein VG940_01960 [Gemmatimonadales bacterium]|nr:hypothetical protein [Gemmatimonadales bacterium]